MSRVAEALRVWTDGTQEWLEVEKQISALEGNELFEFLQAARGEYLLRLDLYLTWQAEAKLLATHKHLVN